MKASDWQKSSFSSEGANCLYVAAPGEDTVLLRESEEPDVILATTHALLGRLLEAVKKGSCSVY